ncbi:hypothetical protein PP182_03825 [Maribacter sp. PR1]|uniref:CDP-glycerol--glycerophosphate glycerophosphotransferase n=1 Tax=Maribacter cobaltidurans TaxID=1178778 RepID=A0ABU7IQE6_9FLAO|nr:MULTISPECIES: hypothetical protein [Maribacter]MDC6387794.1 hypothetical protein [Maribacter sp. PR1]MEE1975182.1 hypothetical protein [Maribacter cobaltidurans]
MSVKKILFVPQNKEHLLNMNPVIDLLVKEGFVCDYLNTNNFFFQNLEYPKEIKTLPFSNQKLSKSFYNISLFKRIEVIYQLRKPIKDITANYDSFVFGNDGAIQRQFIYYANKQNKTCSMILDGLINPPIAFNFSDVFLKSNNKLSDFKEYFSKRLVLFISKTFAKTALSPYLPSTIACGNLNHVYTIGKFSSDEIKKYTLKKVKVFNTGLPRMITYFKEKDKSFIPKYPKSVCFITSAYKWHGMFSYHEFQIKDILLINKCLKEMYPSERVPLYIKLHPREQEEDYKQFQNIKDVKIVKNEPFINTIDNYGILLSNLSTCIVEGLNYGVQVVSLMINFPFWKVKNGFLKNDHIVKIFSEKQLKELLVMKFQTQKVNYAKNSNNDFLSKNTPSSARTIVSNLKTLLTQ